MSDENQSWPTATIGHNSEPMQVEAPKFPVVYKSQPESEDPEVFRVRRNNEISTWRELKTNAVIAGEAEKSLRAKVTETLFPVPKKGTQRYDLGGGFQVKLIHTLSYSLGDKDKTGEDGKKITIREQVEKLETEIVEAHGDEGARILDRLITWKPELSGSEYEKLNDKDPLESDIARRISEILTIKPGSPQLAFEEPKAE